VGTRLQDILDETAAAGRQARRARLRRRADRYVRDGRTLVYWTFAGTRSAVTDALNAPHDPAATRALCRALYRDLKTARALPRRIVGRHMRIEELRLLLACECVLYRQQAASRAAQHGMAAFLRHLASAAE
jgi:hypothetical protein